MRTIMILCAVLALGCASITLDGDGNVTEMRASGHQSEVIYEDTKKDIKITVKGGKVSGGFMAPLTRAVDAAAGFFGQGPPTPIVIQIPGAEAPE